MERLNELQNAVSAAYKAAQEAVSQLGLGHPVSQELVGHWRVLKHRYEDACKGAQCAA